ncbi:SGNH/GDSL hydrolase family protein [Streptosporangium sp. NBC_01469]|uniref:SGNH/GDSL hydrolase family protein n=1 Tax=Streptosporangium sp. NBC_01469 TaxID=2903898 RepID=UPI002E2CE2F0|nr:SGNH/GDSL hydrolase family protein [Streptosporangium sp. NBC_01469]
MPARADFQQLGNGFGGHEWFGYTRTAGRNGDVMKVTGTWELDRAVNGWARVLVHIPKRRAETQQAPYTVYLGGGQSETRYLSQGREQSAWHNLGVFQFAGTPKVSLTNLNLEGDGTAAIAWDAIAFQTLAKRPKHFVVGMGDSFASGEGAGNYYPETDMGYKSVRWNACRRSKDAWIRQAVLPGETQTVGQLADSFDPKMDFAFVACSGAITRDMTTREYQYTADPLGDWPDYRGDAEGRFREVAQMESGFLNKNTTLVALSIGGNDAKFSSIIVNCYVFSCYSANYENDIKADIAHAVRDRMESGVQANVKDILYRVEAKVENAAPGRGKKAKIALMGYPEIAGAGTSCPEFDDQAKGMFQRLSQHFATEEAGMVQTLKAGGLEVSFANPLPAFQGHGACIDSNFPGDKWIHYVNFTKTGPGDFQDVGDGCVAEWFQCASRTSIHPNIDGARAHATVFEEHLENSAVNYTGW